MISVVGKNYCSSGEHGVVRVDMGRILGSLLDGIHLLFTPLLVDWTNDYRLSNYDIARRTELDLGLD